MKSSKYKEWRIAVFKRDGYTCQECGQEGGDLQAHHIKPWSEFPEQRLDVENGMTLCIECHRKAHYSNTVITVENLIELLKKPAVEEALGNLMLKAIDQAMQRTVRVESGKENPGGPPVITEEKWNILDFIAKYLPHVEGAVRGAQADSAKAHNAIGRVAESLGGFVQQVGEALKLATAISAGRKVIGLEEGPHKEAEIVSRQGS